MYVKFVDGVQESIHYALKALQHYFLRVSRYVLNIKMYLYKDIAVLNFLKINLIYQLLFYSSR